MKALVIFLCLLPFTATAEAHKVRFSLSESSTFTVWLVLPKSASVAAHEKTEEGDSIRAQIDASDDGMLVEICDSKGSTIWSHNFGYNLSASGGNTISVSYQSKLRLLLVHYRGYKWAHDHKLLFIEPDHQPLSVREYLTANNDILPLLKLRKDFATDCKYWIYPFRLTNRGVKFECIPLQNPERQTAHPFAQDQKRYTVSAIVDAKRKVTPIAVEATH